MHNNNSWVHESHITFFILAFSVLESPGTLILSVLVRIFLVLQFPTDHVTAHTVEVLP